MLWGLSISEPQLYTYCERWMTWTNHSSMHLAANLGHIDPSSSFWYIWADIFTFAYPAPSPRFPWCTITNVQNLDHMQQIWVEHYAVGCMDYSSMMVIIHSGSGCALNATSMTRMTSLTYILIVDFVLHLGFDFSLNRNRQDDIMLIGRLSTWLVVENFRMACTTGAHTLTNRCVSQFGHWNPEIAGT